MKILVAPDSFKNCMGADTICSVIRKAFSETMPDAEIIGIPLADGGEGTAVNLTSALHGKLKYYAVHGPDGAIVNASAGILPDGKTAVMDLASASGIELIPREKLNPMIMSSRGSGELICKLADDGITHIIIGLGGTATVDGGTGLLQACGLEFKDEHDNPSGFGGASLMKIQSIKESEDFKKLRRAIKITVLSDVRNPLTGKNGAAPVFGPQKGASPEMVDLLDKALLHFAEKMKNAGYVNDSDSPGDGAAGGTGFALRAAFGAEIKPGADFVMEICGIKEALKNASFAITGEGRTDSQTASGKLCQSFADECRRKQIPLILISGSIDGADTEWLRKTFAAWFSLAQGPSTLDSALKNAENNLYRTALSIASLIQTSKRTG